MIILNQIKIGDHYKIDLPKHDRHGQVISVVHDSFVIDVCGRTEITREFCIVEDETNHRFVIRKSKLRPQGSKEDTELLYEHGGIGHSEIGHDPQP